MFGQDSLEQGDEQDGTVGLKTPDTNAQGCSWKRCRRMPTWYRSTRGLAVWCPLPTDCHVSSQTALLAPGRPDQALGAIPGCLPFHLETLPPSWRSPEGLSEEAGLLPQTPPWSPVHHLVGRRLLHGGCFWRGGCSGHPRIYAQMYPSLPLELSLSSGWCRWSSNPLPNATVLFLVSPAP